MPQYRMSRHIFPFFPFVPFLSFEILLGTSSIRAVGQAR